MNSPLALCGIGILFCISGIWFFYTNAFEEDKRIIKPVLLLVAGVILIGWGMAKELHFVR
jgi:hypothetical protein